MVYAFGESLLDVIIHDLDHVVARPGGSMLNASMSLSRAGVDVSLITELGNDPTSKLMIDFLQKHRIHTEYITRYPDNKTAVALAFLDDHKKPTYTFLKDYPVNRTINFPSRFMSRDLFLFGSLYALDKDIQNYLQAGKKAAREAGALILYDPNIRQKEKLNSEGMKELVFEHIRAAHLVKGSDEDFEALFGTTDTNEIFEKLVRINPETLFVMTRGREGASAMRNGHVIHAPAQPVEVVSTIGAGDGFNAGMAAFLSGNPKPVSEWDDVYVEALLEKGIRFASSVCASDENYIQTSFGSAFSELK
ncbi:MAG: hypothetical protein JXR71_03480 [Bacteroidales bacterium]|nr:hypothetical protein [Bacteroidales bacterium]